MVQVGVQHVLKCSAYDPCLIFRTECSFLYLLFFSWSLSTGCVSLQTFCVPYFLLSKTVVFPAHEYLCSGVGQQAGVLLQSSDARVLAVVSGVGSSVLWCWETPPTDPMNMHSLETEILGSLSRVFLRYVGKHLLWLIWPPPYSGAFQGLFVGCRLVGNIAISFV